MTTTTKPTRDKHVYDPHFNILFRMDGDCYQVDMTECNAENIEEELEYVRKRMISLDRIKEGEVIQLHS